MSRILGLVLVLLIALMGVSIWGAAQGDTDWACIYDTTECGVRGWKSPSFFEKDRCVPVEYLEGFIDDPFVECASTK